MSGGSCATSVTTSSGYAATSASAVDRAPAAREHVHRTGAERLDHRVQIARLDRRRVVFPAVSANAAAEPARVIGDNGAVGKVRGQSIEATGGHRLTDHEQRQTSVRGWQRAAHVVGDVRLDRLEYVRLYRHHGPVDLARVENSSVGRGPVDVRGPAGGVCLGVDELEPQGRREILNRGSPWPSTTGCRIRRYSSTSPSRLSDWANAAPPQLALRERSILGREGPAAGPVPSGPRNQSVE